MSARRIFARRQSGSRLTRWAARTLVLAAAILFGGFVWFAVTVDSGRPDAPSADGIVALTGGESRLDAAVALLEQGAGERLLISGVDPGTTRDDIRALFARTPRSFDCCVDLGWTAKDTVGNAAEAAAWTREKGYRSLIVVTAHYHMPRALLELSAALPGVALIPYPVAPETVRLDSWWSDPATLKLLAGEYVKYLASLARLSANRALG